MTPLKLRFPDEPAALAALAQFRGEGGWIVASHTHALDVIGTIYEPATLDDAGEVVTPPVALPGWHVNLQTADAALATALAPYVVTPAQPVREWAS